jgi:hypothetical protein
MVKIWPGYIGREWRNVVTQKCRRKKSPVQAIMKSASFLLAEWKGRVLLKHRNPPSNLHSVTT